MMVCPNCKNIIYCGCPNCKDKQVALGHVVQISNDGFETCGHCGHKMSIDEWAFEEYLQLKKPDSFSKVKDE